MVIGWGLGCSDTTGRSNSSIPADVLAKIGAQLVYSCVVCKFSSSLYTHIQIYIHIDLTSLRRCEDFGLHKCLGTLYVLFP